MTFPQKHTRSITVDGVPYFWHLNPDWERKTSWIVVARVHDEHRQLLFLSPYHHDILPTRGTVTSAIRWALSSGWNPSSKGAPFRVAYNGQTFEKITEKI